MKKYQDGSPMRPSMKPVKKTSAVGYFPVQNAPKVTITPKAKTGGMVNSNASVQASKVAKGRPAKSAEPKGASTKTKGKTGGTSKAPKTAVPKAKYGMSMKKSC
jgi:hypothetical protein